MTYKVFDISKFQEDVLEPLGTKSKYWFTGDDGNDYLFKSIKTFDGKGEVVYRHGEDWSEKISCEIAKFLRIPCAYYELACNNETRGVVTRNFVTNDATYLITGSEVIRNYSSAVPSTAHIKDIDRQNILHIYSILNRIIKRKPIGFRSLPGVKSASDFFTGYLMLDALISNQDRHSENWGLIISNKGSYHLAPTFDHAASLGRNESDETRKTRLESKDQGQQVSSYIKKAKSYFYLRGNRLKTFKAFEYFGILKPVAAIQWIEQLEILTDTQMRTIIDAIPDEIMSNVSKKFVLQMLLCSRANIMALKPFFEKNLDPLFRIEQIRNYE